MPARTLLAAVAMVMPVAVEAQEVFLFAAGSLRTALNETVADIANRLGLDAPESFTERLYARLVAAALE